MANHPKNYGLTIPLPPKSDYFYESMPPAKQKLFDEWYTAELSRGATFCLDEMLAAYCVSSGNEGFFDLSRPDQ